MIRVSRSPPNRFHRGLTRSPLPRRAPQQREPSRQADHNPQANARIPKAAAEMTLVPIARYATRDRENGKNPRWHRHERGHCGRWGHDNRATPDDPVDIASGDTSNSPYGAAYNARRQNPGLPHRIDDKHHPSRFFPRRADQEYGEKRKKDRADGKQPRRHEKGACRDFAPDRPKAITRFLFSACEEAHKQNT